MRILTVLTALIFIYPKNAFAYLDPATGSSIFAIITIVATSLIFYVKNIFYFLKTYFSSNTNKELISKQFNVVLFSEGGAYFRCFLPIMKELDFRNIDYTYLSMDENDPGLNCASSSFFIGKSYQAFYNFKKIKSKIVVMTTPGLDVIEIKKSKNVGHYMHIIHAPTDIAFYQLFSFDHYDSVVINGHHQKRSLRKLEALRKTKKKSIYLCGCSYYDYLETKMNNMQIFNNKERFIIVSPTWGPNSLLKQLGTGIIDELIAKKWHVILRFHPQSLISEKKFVNNITEQYKDINAVEIDIEYDSIDKMAKSDIMISDISGVIFDYIFLLEKPVICFQGRTVVEGTEAEDLPYTPWESSILTDIATVVYDKKFDVNQLVNQALSDKKKLKVIAKIKREYIVNFGKSAPHIVNKISNHL